MRFRLQHLNRFLPSDARAAILLMACVLVSLVLSNSPLQENYLALWEKPLHLGHLLPFALSGWINDGLMAVFFLLVGLEIKKELVMGALSSPSAAMLPVLAALGGALMPALIYVLCNYGQTTAAGWGIPMATDIAFALAILSLAGKGLPVSLRVFLAALAVADDLMAILVIAVFYTPVIQLVYLLAAAGIWAFMWYCNIRRRQALYLYLIPGLLLWYCVHHAGIHATIAGVLTALTIPVRSANNKAAPALRLEHALVKPVNFVVMPLFALANTAIPLSAALWTQLLSPAGIGIILGLLLGKVLGIVGMTRVVVSAGWANLPVAASWRQMIGIGLLGGVGFTMSIFIALLSFADPGLQALARLAVLVASLLAGISGYLLLRRSAAALSASKRST